MIEPANSITQAIWLTDKIPEYTGTVASLVPSGFEAYVRILHPLRSNSHENYKPLPWSSLGNLLGVKIDSSTQWEQLETLISDELKVRFEAPYEGSLDVKTLKHIGTILTSFEKLSSKVFFGVWDGYKRTYDQVQQAPMFHLCKQEYRLLQGCLEHIADSVCPSPFYQSSNLIWPENQSWFLTTDIDFRSTYIGGTEAVASVLLSKFPQSAFRVSENDCVTLSES